eukprot:m.155597 g.155597  ORF g.155597 m.155597 type:complete len:143 (+) comp20808_c2_seq2:1989-2417(+)
MFAPQQHTARENALVADQIPLRFFFLSFSAQLLAWPFSGPARCLVHKTGETPLQEKRRLLMKVIFCAGRERKAQIFLFLACATFTAQDAQGVRREGVCPCLKILSLERMLTALSLANEGLLELDGAPPQAHAPSLQLQNQRP